MLFNKRREPIKQTEPDFDAVINYLCGLSKEEYSMTFRVSDIQRKADEDAAKVLNRELEPRTFIDAEPQLLTDLIFGDDPIKTTKKAGKKK